jgi:hypothetical protein
MTGLTLGYPLSPKTFAVFIDRCDASELSEPCQMEKVQHGKPGGTIVVQLVLIGFTL